jgi:hypothetical protein
MSLSLTIGGAVSEHVGPRPVMVTMAAISLLWGAVYLASTRGLRAATTKEVMPAAGVS